MYKKLKTPEIIEMILTNLWSQIKTNEATLKTEYKVFDVKTQGQSKLKPPTIKAIERAFHPTNYNCCMIGYIINLKENVYHFKITNKTLNLPF